VFSSGFLLGRALDPQLDLELGEYLEYESVWKSGMEWDRGTVALKEKH